MVSNIVLQIFKTAPEFADVANSRVLNSKPPVTSLSSSQVRPQRGSAPPPPAGSQMNSSVSGSTVVDSLSSQDPNNSLTSSALVNSNNSSSSIYQSPDVGSTAYSQTKAKLRPTTAFASSGQFLPGWKRHCFVSLRFYDYLLKSSYSTNNFFIFHLFASGMARIVILMWYSYSVMLFTFCITWCLHTGVLIFCHTGSMKIYLVSY